MINTGKADHQFYKRMFFCARSGFLRDTFLKDNLVCVLLAYHKIKPECHAAFLISVQGGGGEGDVVFPDPFILG
jgi:hypothetical protein